MTCCQPKGPDPVLMSGTQLPISEVHLHVPDSSEGWDELVKPLADVLTRGDVPTELNSAKIAIMHLKTRAPKKYQEIMTQIVSLGALKALIERIEKPVPSAVPPQSIWWREVCLSRFSDCQILSVFCHSLDLVPAVQPYRASVLKAIKFLLVSPHFKHIYSVRFLAVEIIISLVVLAPDFDTFVVLHREGLLPILSDLMCSTSEKSSEEEDWVVYDLGSPPVPLCVQSICISIFAYVISECNVVTRGGSFLLEAKSILSDLENLPVFQKAVNAIRDHRKTASLKYIVDSLQHLTMIFCFGGRTQCLQRENLTWVDEAAKFFAEFPDEILVAGEPADDTISMLRGRVRSDCGFILNLIRERHEPNRILNRARLPDLRQKFRVTAVPPMDSPSDPSCFPGEKTPSLKKPSCRVCKSESELKRCQRCLSVQYCSRECQVADWKNHKPDCYKE